jgi:hypothetical protein
MGKRGFEERDFIENKGELLLKGIPNDQVLQRVLKQAEHLNNIVPSSFDIF